MYCGLSGKCHLGPMGFICYSTSSGHWKKKKKSAGCHIGSLVSSSNNKSKVPLVTSSKAYFHLSQSKKKTEILPEKFGSFWAEQSVWSIFWWNKFMAIPNLIIRGATVHQCKCSQDIRWRQWGVGGEIINTAAVLRAAFPNPERVEGNRWGTTALTANARMLATVSVIRAALRGPPECTLCLDALQAAGED